MTVASTESDTWSVEGKGSDAGVESGVSPVSLGL